MITNNYISFVQREVKKDLLQTIVRLILAHHFPQISKHLFFIQLLYCVGLLPQAELKGANVYKFM